VGQEDVDSDYLFSDFLKRPASGSRLTDPVKPEFAIDHLVDRLAQKLGEVRFAQFLERFADDLIELDQNERRP
jgi:hypothetical protein